MDTYYMSGATLGMKGTAVSVFLALSFSLEPLRLKGKETEASGSEGEGLVPVVFCFCSRAGSPGQFATPGPVFFLGTVSQTEQIILLFFPLKLPINSQPQKNMACNDCKGPCTFRRKMKSLFYVGLASLAFC